MERDRPRQYDWSGCKHLLRTITGMGFKVKVSAPCQWRAASVHPPGGPGSSSPACVRRATAHGHARCLPLTASGATPAAAGAACAQVNLCFNSAPGIPLPKWVHEVGEASPDIWFTDKSGARSKECLSFGVDERECRGLGAHGQLLACAARARTQRAACRGARPRAPASCARPPTAPIAARPAASRARSAHAAGPHGPGGVL